MPKKMTVVVEVTAVTQEMIGKEIALVVQGMMRTARFTRIGF